MHLRGRDSNDNITNLNCNDIIDPIKNSLILPIKYVRKIFYQLKKGSESEEYEKRRMW